jgi:hypothetical protein
VRATIRTRSATSLLLAVLAAGFLAIPAVGMVRYQPDVLVRLATPLGPWHGNNMYNATGAHQSAIDEVAGGSAFALDLAFTFDISIQNDGAAADRFKLRATGAGGRWTVTYSGRGANITAAVLAGTYRTPVLAPGAAYLIHAKMAFDSSSSSDTMTAARLVTVRSVTNATRLDAVKFGILWKPILPSG